MSNKKDNLDKKLSKAKNSAHSMPNKNTKGMTAEVAKTRTTKDTILWVVAFLAIVAAALVNFKLPGIWQPASDLWTRVGIITALIVFAVICLVLTNQGTQFKVLLHDARIELRRVTWPSKSETIQYTWQSLLVIGIVAFIVWLLDNFFNSVVGIFIG